MADVIFKSRKFAVTVSNKHRHDRIKVTVRSGSGKKASHHFDVNEALRLAESIIEAARAVNKW